MKLFAEIYRSTRKAGAYLYVARGQDLQELPAALLQVFGRAEKAMDLVLTADKQLARADAAEVIQSIQEKGFYLQMPPFADGYMAPIPAGDGLVKSSAKTHLVLR